MENKEIEPPKPETILFQREDGSLITIPKPQVKTMVDTLKSMLQEPVNEYGDTRTTRLVNTLLNKAEEGNLKAIEIVFDRVEGKPIQNQVIDLKVQENPIVASLQLLVENQIRNANISIDNSETTNNITEQPK